MPTLAFRTLTTRWSRPLFVAAWLALAASTSAQAAPAAVHLDYAYYSPTSLVLRHFGWLKRPCPRARSVGC